MKTIEPQSPTKMTSHQILGTLIITLKAPADHTTASNIHLHTMEAVLIFVLFFI